MTAAEYWDFVDRHRPADNDPEAHCRALAAALGRLSPADIVDYDVVNCALVRRAYRADLWSAAYQVNGGCSDDGFEYFLWWLVMQGEDVYELAVADPESLAEITGMDGDELDCELYGYLAMRAYRAVTGEEEMPPRRVPTRRLRGRWVRTDSGVRRKWPMMWRLMTRPPRIDPNWLAANNGTALAVCRAVHDGRRWGDLPVLADALQDAGCADEFLLGHLRASRPHARHCWATRLLLQAAG